MLLLWPYGMSKSLLRTRWVVVNHQPLKYQPVTRSPKICRTFAHSSRSSNGKALQCRTRSLPMTVHWNPELLCLSDCQIISPTGNLWKLDMPKSWSRWRIFHRAFGGRGVPAGVKGKSPALLRNAYMVTVTVIIRGTCKVDCVVAIGYWSLDVKVSPLWHSILRCRVLVRGSKHG